MYRMIHKKALDFIADYLLTGHKGSEDIVGQRLDRRKGLVNPLAQSRFCHLLEGFAFNENKSLLWLPYKQPRD